MGEDPVETTSHCRVLFEAARAAWPSFEVSFELYSSRIDQDEATRETTSVNAGDVYLACACGDGNARALAEFESKYLIPARDAIARIDRAPDFIAEVQQLLRERLLVGPDAKIKGYRGRGPLAAWLRTAAVRTAFNVRRTRMESVDEPHGAEALDQLLDPELKMLKERHNALIQGTLERALAELDASDRLRLRYYYVDRLTLTKIAALEQAGVSTVFRRLDATTKALLAAIKRELAERLQLSGDSIDSLIRGVGSHIHLSLGRFLKDASTAG
jgi:RNA polymerase sigma-70 factor (ECF subfamily)